VGLARHRAWHVVQTVWPAQPISAKVVTWRNLVSHLWDPPYFRSTPTVTSAYIVEEGIPGLIPRGKGYVSGGRTDI
jgi:hypothetical protein